MRRAAQFMLLVTAGAAACARYTPAPVDPVGMAAAVAARRLDDPALVDYLARQGTRVDGEDWSEADLVVAAYYFHPAMEEARANRQAAEAGLLSAGARARPDVDGEVGYGVTGSDAFESPWVAAVAAVFILELGGKRRARIAAARARAAVAEVEVDATAWRVARGVLNAAEELAAARERVGEARLERQAAEALAAAAGARYARGEIGHASLAATEAAALESRAGEAARVAQARVAETALAEAIGVPHAALEGVSIRPAARLACRAVEADDSLVQKALRTRAEVGRAIARYAVAEGDLRLAVAGSYPDLALGPGFTWDQGVGRWSVLAGLPRLPVDGNRGPIAEAMRRREVAAAGVTAAQLQVLSEVEVAAARCAAARGELATADSVATASERRLDAARRAFARGEIAAADTAAVLLPLVRARTAALEARRREAGAALALSAAVGQWPALERADPRIPPRPEPEP